jgi:hypothetical protein
VDTLELVLEVRRPLLGAPTARVRMRLNGAGEDPRADPHGSATSPAALERSAGEAGRHFIVNCTCGDPGCASLEGVEVSHVGADIVWLGHDVVPVGAGELRFEAAAYRRQVERLCGELRAAMRAEPRLLLFCDDGFR